MKKEVVINIIWSNILSAWIFIFISVASILFQESINSNVFLNVSWLRIVYIFAIIVLHEYLHSLGFRYFAKAPKKNIKFGFNKKYLAPYCSCNDFEMDKMGYLYSIFLPNIVLSLSVLMLVILSKNLFWSIFLGFVVSAGAGDYYMAYLVSKYDKNVKFIDHPTKPGFFVITREN